MNRIRSLALAAVLGAVGCGSSERVQAPTAGNDQKPVAPAVAPPAGKAGPGNVEARASVPDYAEKGTLSWDKNSK